MRRYLLFLGIMIVGMSVFNCQDDKKEKTDEQFRVEVLEPVPINKSNDTRVFVHYMPWYETPQTSGNGEWGIHWTMATKNPDQTGSDGYPDIASYFNPLIGPYASSDKDVIEYHLLLMKYAGIDGVLIDWYGTYDVNDYRSNKENTDALVDMLDEVGLKFAIVYEDRTLSEVIGQGVETNMISAARKDMRFLENEYFSRDTYIKEENAPLLLVFGPVNLKTGEEWTSAFQDLDPKPFFLTLWNQSDDAGSTASGEYSWVYQDNSHLEEFYLNRAPELDFAMGSAYPGFVDFYEEGGWGGSLGWEILHNNGETLDQTLQMAASEGVDCLQLITWNDYGEGTMIEPTHEFEFTCLEKVKDFSGVAGNFSVFEQIFTLFEMRKKYANKPSIQEKLDQVFFYFVSVQPDLATDLLADIENGINQ